MIWYDKGLDIAVRFYVPVGETTWLTLWTYDSTLVKGENGKAKFKYMGSLFSKL